MKRLTEIANECGTDKGTWGQSHGFSEFYNDIFENFKERAINESRKLNILEVGVQYGKSLKMFEMFFEDTANIYGIDIDISNTTAQSENVKLYQFNAVDKEKINEFIEELKDIKFDIILEDASHIFKDQINTLLYLYKHVKEDGIYIIEDLHTSLIWDWGYTMNSTLYYLIFNDKLDFMTDEEHNELQEHIKTVTVWSNSKPNDPNSGYRGITSVITLK